VHVEATTADALAVVGADTIAVGVFEGEEVAHDFGAGTLRALLERGEARRAFKQLALAHADSRRVLLVGLGARDEFTSERARVAAAVVHGRASELGTRTLVWEVPHHVSDDVVAGLVEGTLLHTYQFNRYKSAGSGCGEQIERLIVSAHHDVSAAVHEAAVITAAQNRARDLGNTPPNDLTPAKLAEYAVALADRHERVTATLLDEQQIIDAGMGAFAAVSQGSGEEARLIRLAYDGAPAADGPPLGLLGKAVTFDVGGLTVKHPASVYENKYDMCGGAAVIEAIAALAELEVPVRVLGVIGATENVIGERAMRPSDIVSALDGTTIEINNPDAEGRLVLADCLVYARREGCGRLVDVATLTGAIVSALGSAFAGLFSNDDELATAVERSADRTGELVWRMPLHPYYAHQTKGRDADLTNRPEPRQGLASAAAEFLRHFAGDVPWAHLDIAGTAYDVRSDYLVGKGATGFGVRLLVELARNRSGGLSPTSVRTPTDTVRTPTDTVRTPTDTVRTPTDS
jgi:leucyl aminopeptidase